MCHLVLRRFAGGSVAAAGTHCLAQAELSGATRCRRFFSFLGPPTVLAPGAEGKILACSAQLALFLEAVGRTKRHSMASDKTLRQLPTVDQYNLQSTDTEPLSALTWGFGHHKNS